MTSYLFIYGTLLPGLCRHDAMQGAQRLGAATTFGQLFDLGEYPALIPGAQRVHGELYQVDAGQLARVDEVEEFIPTDEAASLYLRRRVKVTLDDVAFSVEAWTYHYNRSVKNCTLIESGDYRHYLIQAP